MRKRLTTEEFIRRAKLVHGDRYDYSKSIYSTAKEKLIINCSKHGDFYQSSESHLSGSGCKKCGVSSRASARTGSTYKFITRAIERHGDRYSYDRSIFTGLQKKITITCKMHGEFEQIASNHLSGKGCQKCGIIDGPTKRLLSNVEFIQKSINAHGNRYSYHKCEYKGSRDKVCITCSTHGDFWQDANAHIQGKGCQLCGYDAASEKQRKTTDDFIKCAIKTHGYKYDYSLVSYTESKGKVKIICKVHGVFEQNADKHLQGSGCSGCASHGFDATKTSFVYFLAGTNSIKVGITRNIKSRVGNLKLSTPFDFNLIAKIKTTGTEAMRIEKYYHKKYESAGLAGFDGATEWLKYSPELMSEIMNENTTL